MDETARYWDAKFSDEAFAYGRRPNEFLRRHVDLLARGSRVLSLGEGEGRNAVWLGERGLLVHAVDRSAAALQKLRVLAEERGVDISTRCIDVCRLEPGDARWDAVLLLHMHLLPADRQAVHRRVVRALKPGGHVILEALRPEQLEQPTTGPTDPRRLYRVEDLKHDFDSLRIEHLAVEDRDIEAGEHRGPTSVVQLIARRPR